MSDERVVVGLDGRPLPEGVHVCPQLLENVERLLEDVKSGQITSLGVCSVWRERGSVTFWHLGPTDSSFTLMGSATRLLHEMNTHIDSNPE